MMEEERLDIFNDQMEHIGITTRKEAHEKGLWHQTFHLWIISSQGNKELILFQKRDSLKKDFPNKFDITSAGHLLAGESERDGIREVEEEIGISLSFDDLYSIGIIKEQITLGKSFFDNEFCHTYFYKSNLPLADYNLQEEEVAGIIAFEIEQLLRLFKGDIKHVSGSGIIKRDPVEDLQVSLEDFVPHVGDYYIDILKEAKRKFF